MPAARIGMPCTESDWRCCDVQVVDKGIGNCNPCHRIKIQPLGSAAVGVTSDGTPGDDVAGDTGITASLGDGLLATVSWSEDGTGVTVALFDPGVCEMAQAARFALGGVG